MVQPHLKQEATMNFLKWQWQQMWHDFYCGRNSGFPLCCVLWGSFLQFRVEAIAHHIERSITGRYYGGWADWIIWRICRRGFNARDMNHVPCPSCRMFRRERAKRLPLRCDIDISCDCSRVWMSCNGVVQRRIFGRFQ